MRARKLTAILAVLFLAASCRQEATVPGAPGRPERIISLGPAISHQLYLLGAEDRLIANTSYCERPEAAKKKMKIGNVTHINIEKIVSLRPDLVVAIGLTHPKHVKKLENLGIRVVRFPYPNSFGEMCDEFIRLGELVDEKAKAVELVKQARSGVDRIRKQTSKLRPKRVFAQIGAKPLFTVTKDSFVNDLVEFAGGANIAKAEHSGIYSRENVIKENPEVIIIATMGIAGEKEKAAWQDHRSISAVTNNAIHVMDSYNMCSPTPVSFVATLEELVRILHPNVVLE